MRALSAADLLELCEDGRGAAPVEQALLMLRFAFPLASTDDLARLTIGQRDARLLRLRELTLGAQLNGLVDCPACHERLELPLDSRSLRGSEAALPETVEPLNAEIAFHMDGYDITFRLPTSADLLAILGLTDASLARQQLLDACLISVSRDGEASPASALPPDVLNVLLERMGEADPLANLTVTVTCPACGHASPIIVDIVSYFWNEITAWAARILREVHVLASAYGWREADILAMSAWRRQCYLEMIDL